MDEKIILCKRDNLYFVTGEGPVDTGAGSTLTEPNKIASDVGCIEPRSVVTAAPGVFFQSAKGIYLLDRGLNIVYVGAPVEDYNTQTLTSAVLLDDVNQIRWTTDSGRTLVYDYFFKQWSTFTNHEGKAALMSRGVYHYLRNDGEVYQETQSVFTDNGTTINLDMTTAWLKLAGLQGFQRVRRFGLIGDFLDEHKLRINVGYDYQAYFRDTFTWSPNDVLQSSNWGSGSWGSGNWGGTGDGVYQTVGRTNKQKCQSIRFQLRDVDVVGQSYSIAGLALEVGLKTGIYRLPSTKSALSS